VERQGQTKSRPETKSNSDIPDKNKIRSIVEEIDRIWSKTRGCFGQKRTWRKAKELALSSIVGYGRRTITGMISTRGRQFKDWTSDYRLFSQERFDHKGVFDVLRRETTGKLPENAPIVAAMDDTLLRKSGKKVSGASYFRDPCGPRFHTNLTWGERFLQVSQALFADDGPRPARMIPIDLVHCPVPRKPGKKASEEKWSEYRRAKKEANLSLKGLKSIADFRGKLDDDPDTANRNLVVSVDGGYTNGTILKNLPHRTVIIGRIRKDAKLYYPPDGEKEISRGRRALYGKCAPTPEEFRRDNAFGWREVKAFTAGKIHTFKVKTMAPLRWRTLGADREFRLVVVHPLCYRLSKGSRLIYRRPAYLISTDIGLPLEEILQYYIWRWGIELNFREEKQLFGMSNAQVRHPDSVERVPALIAASYGLLLLAGHNILRVGGEIEILPRAKWRRKGKEKRLSAQGLVGHLRAELWGRAMGLGNFSDFVNVVLRDTKGEKSHVHLPSALFYAAS
jgi:hypothetical protein